MDCAAVSGVHWSGEMNQPLTVACVPCGSCPYRRDVPSGIWHKSEYDKLPLYDGETWEQSQNLFLCHQKDGKICAGWLGCHGPEELLAIRLAVQFGRQAIDPAVFKYRTDVPLFSSGAEARAHGIQAIKQPRAEAQKMISGLLRKRRITK
jgi:hypothetical protein